MSRPGREKKVRTGNGALRRRFLLPWLVFSGMATLLLFLFHYLLFSSPFAGGYGAVFHALRQIVTILLPVVALSMLAYILLVGGIAALLCINLLHRIAGPIFRLERVLGGFLEGEAVRPFFIRHGDLVPEVASSFNEFVDRLREDRRRWVAAIENAERLRLRDRETCRAGMENALAELVTLLSRYR